MNSIDFFNSIGYCYYYASIMSKDKTLAKNARKMAKEYFYQANKINGSKKSMSTLVS